MDKEIVKKTIEFAKKYDKKIFAVISNMSIALERKLQRVQGTVSQRFFVSERLLNRKNIRPHFLMEPIKDIKNLQTPCFILDKKELERSIKGYQDALKSNFKRSIVGYSVKTNSVPACMKLAGEMGAYAEVVSHDEWELARLCGFDQQHIVYNGPMKSKETFLDAVEHGTIVNIETKRELEWLKELPNDGAYKVGLRLNINISQVSPEDADGDNDNSRFGFSDETNQPASQRGNGGTTCTAQARTHRTVVTQ